jgi:hypothetical protein
MAPEASARSADKGCMSTSAINAISAVTLEQGLAAIENAAATGLSTGTTGTAVAGSAGQSDSSQISPLGQLINTLQQLQKTDPAKFAQVTQQIATNLQADAQTAQTQGNSSEAKQLTALAADFSSASKSGKVSTLLQDLTPASGNGHHRHGSGVASTTGSAIDSTANADTASNQLLSLLQANESQSAESTNLKAAATILNTLNASGIATS